MGSHSVNSGRFKQEASTRMSTRQAGQRMLKALWRRHSCVLFSVPMKKSRDDSRLSRLDSLRHVISRRGAGKCASLVICAPNTSENASGSRSPNALPYGRASQLGRRDHAGPARQVVDEFDLGPLVGEHCVYRFHRFVS